MHSISLIHFYLALSIGVFAPWLFPSVGSWKVLSDPSVSQFSYSFKCQPTLDYFPLFSQRAPLGPSPLATKVPYVILHPVTTQHASGIILPLVQGNTPQAWISWVMYFKLGLPGPIQEETVASALCDVPFLWAQPGPSLGLIPFNTSTWESVTPMKIKWTNLSSLYCATSTIFKILQMC